MKNIIFTLSVIIALTLITIRSQAQGTPVGSGFTYQGELLDNGSPANGSYDITLDLYFQNTGGTSIASEAYTNIPVTNGLFSIENVDFGDMIYADNEQYYIQVSVRTSGVGAFEDLTPRSALQAVPYAVQAEFLAAGGATNGDVLQFNGSDWVPNALNIPSSLWTDNGSSVSYLGRVGVGVVNTGFGFQIKGSGTQHPFEVTDASGVGIMRITDTGDIGIRTVSPQARLHVFGDAGSIPLRVDIAGQQKLKILSNGGLRVGGNSIVGDSVIPADGLYVEGSVKQNVNSGGMLKYAVHARCGIAASKIKSFTGTQSLGLIAVSNNGFGPGKCRITFPSDIDTRYYQATVKASFGNRTVTCNSSPSIPTNALDCAVTNSSTGVLTPQDIMVLVY